MAQQIPNTVKFIAPNGARFISKDWRRTLEVFPSEVVLHVIFHDPLLSTEAKA